MAVPKNDTKIITMLLILLSLFIIVFFTKSFYFELIDSMDENDTKEALYESKKQEVDKLSTDASNLKKTEVDSEQTDSIVSNKEIKKYLSRVSEDELIEEIYWFAESYSRNGWEVAIRSLWFSQWATNELGFEESLININARVKNTASMKDFLDFITENEKYSFFIESFSVPEKTQSYFNIRIPAKVFYKTFDWTETKDTNK